MKRTNTAHYSELVVNSLLLLLQVIGLLAFQWDAVYVIYLCWIDLCCLAVYSYFKKKQYEKEAGWKDFKKRRTHLFDADPDMYIFIRILFLLIYLLVIAVVVIPLRIADDLAAYPYRLLENDHNPVQGLWITDTFFVLSVVLTVMYYLKEMVSPPSMMEKNMIEFSFHLASKDPRFLSPFFAFLTFFLPAIFFAALRQETTYNSLLYAYAVWLLLFRFMVNALMWSVVKDEMKKQ